MEIKDARGDLTTDEMIWHRSWRGHPVVVVRTTDEALVASGMIRPSLSEADRSIPAGCRSPATYKD
jgi:hypothetical protein